MSKGRTATHPLWSLALASRRRHLPESSAAAGAATSREAGPVERWQYDDLDPAPDAAAIKSLAHTEITHRVETLNAAVARVKAAKGLSSGQDPLETYLGQDVGPLQQLDSKIQGDGTGAGGDGRLRHDLQ